MPRFKCHYYLEKKSRLLVCAAFLFTKKEYAAAFTNKIRIKKELPQNKGFYDK